MIVHVVRPGETVELIAASYGVDPDRLAADNAVPDTGAATALILQHPELFRDYEITKGKMDDVFLAVTGKKLVGGIEK